MTDLLWSALARTLAWPPIARRMVRRAQRTPYLHIVKEGRVYMERWWLFNPYDHATRQPRYRWCPVSIRVHRILKADDDRHLHDHPWNARTLILEGSYVEEGPDVVPGRRARRLRRAGDTARIGFGRFHRIAHVSDGGATTLFISGRYRGTWGFRVDGKKVPWRQYLGMDKETS